MPNIHTRSELTPPEPDNYCPVRELKSSAAWFELIVEMLQVDCGQRLREEVESVRRDVHGAVQGLGQARRGCVGQLQAGIRGERLEVVYRNIQGRGTVAIVRARCRARAYC